MAQQQTIGTHQTTHRMKNGIISVVYHQTEIVKVTATDIILDTGGWYTSTTKTRMNQASNQYDVGFKVFQKNSRWFAVYKNETHVFENGTCVIAR